MARSKSNRLPPFESLDELVDFFDAHDLGDYWEQLPPAHFEVTIKTKKHLVAIDEEIVPQLNQVAKSRRVSSERLINKWLKEKLAASKRAQC